MKFWRSSVLVMASFLFAIAVSIPSLAQYRAGVQGVVMDTTGAVIPGAMVTLTSKETNLAKNTTSSGSGVFSIGSLAPGAYTLVVEKPGFQKKTLDDVRISAEQIQAVNVQLQVGQATQTVTVSANEVPVINTETAALGGTITTRQVENAPTFGRDPFQLLQLAPGAFGDNAHTASGSSANLPGNAGPGGTSGSGSIFQTENQVQISANGLRTTSNSYQVDGVSVNSLAWGGAAVITPNQESVKEVRVETNSYNAENGRAGGAQVMVVSKNGTNSWHGSALMRAARPGLNAFQRWNGPNAAVTRDTHRFNQFAGSLGGPIIHNKLFFFFSYETLRENTVVPNTGWYETPQFLSTVQSAKPNSIAAKILGYPGEGVSFSSISQTATCATAGISQCANIFDSSGHLIGLDIGSPLNTPLGTSDPTWVSGGAPGVGGGLDGIPDIMFVNTIGPSESKPQQYQGRLDFQASQRDLIAFSIYQVPVTSTFFNGPVRAANLWHNDRTNQSGTLLWNRTISASVLNEARINASRWHWNEVESNPQEPWGLPASNIDTLMNANVQFFGAPGPSTFAQTTYNARDTLSWMQHNHALKFGADIYWEQNNDSQIWNARPAFGFRNLWDFANDAPYSQSGNFDPATGVPTPVTKHIRSKIYAFFAQDDWKVRPNLTLNLGLRWEYFTPITETHGLISNAILGSGANTLTDLRLKLGGNLYNASKNNWGPQIGFAWVPRPSLGNFVIRGGFGIGYTREEEAITLNGRSNPPFVSSVNLVDSPGINYEVPGDVHQFFNWPATPAAKTAIDPNTNLPVSTPVVINIFPQDLPTPTTYRYSLDTQYSFPAGWVGSLSYQGSGTRHYTRQVNLNWFHPQNLNPALQGVQYYPNDANQNFNALLAGLRHNISNTLQVDFGYRWSKTIDDGSNEYFIGDYPFDIKFLRGLADYDARHNIKALVLWSPKWFPNADWRQKILGGWTLTPVLNWHTGFPFTPTYNQTSCNVIYVGSGYCNLRPAAYLGGAGDNFSTDVFKQNNGNFPGGGLAFFVPPTFASDGTIPAPPGIGRNSFRGPGYFNVDLSLEKAFGLPNMKVLGEDGKIAFRADFFNIFNKLNVTNLDNQITSATFGEATSALAGRIVNLQVRFSF